MELEFTGKKVLVIGAGISGFAAAKIARQRGAAVVLSDAKAEEELKYDFSELRGLGVELAFGPQEESLLEGVSMLILSPAVPVRVPIVQAAYGRNIRVLTEVEMAYELARSPIAAVTGTNGKTTTVTLLGLLLEAHYGKEKTGVGGNIGVPLSEEALRVGAKGAIAAEISSYQMEATADFHPHVATVLNVTPDHVLRHGSLEVYQQMKEKMFAQLSAGDMLVLNYDDEKVRGMAERAPRGAGIFYFSREKYLDRGVCLAGDLIVLRWGGRLYPLCREGELGIKGGHNVENAMAAIASAFFMGVSPADMVPVLQSFRGVEHRIEPVRELDGVAYYNDSKATNTDSAIKAVAAFEHILLIAGGDDKMTDLTEFMQLVKERCDELILVGAAAERFRQEALNNGYPGEHIHMAGYSMEAAVQKAHELAHGPQTVLLSPACASFDMYTGFEERGRDFKRLVNGL